MAAWTAASMGVVLVAGCGAGSGPAPPGEPDRGYRVTYRFESVREFGHELNADRMEMLTDGGAKVRLTWPGSNEFAVVVSDGYRAVWFRPEDGSSAGSMKVADVPRFVLHEGDGTLVGWCAEARAGGTAEVLDRATTHYTCRDPGLMPLFQARELWVDQATGLVLRWVVGNLRATASRVELEATLPVDSFSVRPPTSAEDRAQPAIEPFRLPRVGGGEVIWTDYRGEPAVVVVGEAAGIRRVVERLLPVTGGGKSPQLLGLLVVIPPDTWNGSLLNPDDTAALTEQVSAKAGSFEVPVGIDFKGAVTASIPASVEAQPGRTAVALIRSDGTLARVTTDAASDSELRGWIAALA